MRFFRMENDYICPQCGEGYDLAGTCEMCQEDLIPTDEYEDEVSEVDGLSKEDGEESLEVLGEEELGAKDDRFDDEDNY